jgi:AraC-like DNA-binding protein
MSAVSRVPTVSARLALPLVAHWRRRHGDAAALLRALDLDEHELRLFDGRVALDRWSALHAACTQKSGNPAFGLEAVAQLERGAFPLELQLVSSQPTLHAGLLFVQPYAHASVDGLEVALIAGGRERSQAVFTVGGQPLGPPPFAEYYLAMLWAFTRAVAPLSRPPTAVRFHHRWARHGAALAELFGAPVRFGETQVGFELDLLNLDVAVPGADPELGRVLASSAATMLAASAAPTLRLRDRARHWLAEHLVGEGPLAARLAAAMHVSERTLRRRLSDEGTSLRDLADDARRERALALLETGRWSLERVALELGFSSASAFGRAFRKWTGRPPADFAGQYTNGTKRLGTTSR